MEVVGDDVVLSLEQGSRMVMGRRNPSNLVVSADPTVSRRQLALEWQNAPDSNSNGNARVYLQVLGANPICILRSGAGAAADSSLEFLKKGESAYVGIGDKFSLSVKEPHFFALKKGGIEEAVERRERRAVERKHNEGIDLSLESLNLSYIDPVAEFGFLVEGSEFEQFGKRCINDMDKWSWYLIKDPEKSSDDEDSVEEGKPIGGKGTSEKKKEAKSANRDIDWMGESEEEKERINKLKMGKNPTPVKTRSKSSRRHATSNAPKSVTSKQNQLDNNIDDDDETLGGFIVDDEVETTEDEDEEDELTSDDFEEEDEVRGESTIGQRKPLCKYGTNCS
ncbi:hypothetical protein KI387_001578, partial [Taxus chinensis]